MIYPFLWSVTASFKTNRQIFSGNPLDLIPRPATFDNYRQAFALMPFGRFLLNSAIFQRDLPLLQGTILVLAMFFVLLNLLVDGLQSTLDPRMHRG